MSKKEYDREIAMIKQEYKGNDSKKLLLLKRLDAKYMYHHLCEKAAKKTPGGIFRHDNISADKISSAIEQICDVVNLIRLTIPQDMLSNIRFYVNTPYYSRSAEDKFPCYSWNHPKIKALCDLVTDALVSYEIPITEDNLCRLNIIIRCYRSGDVLGFHTDREEFGDHVCGLMLYNKYPEYGLLLIKGKQSFMLDESAPYSWMLTGDSRWEWEHGYSSPDIKGAKDELIRISVTFRYYNDTKQIPKHILITE